MRKLEENQWRLWWIRYEILGSSADDTRCSHVATCAESLDDVEDVLADHDGDAGEILEARYLGLVLLPAE